MNYSDIMRVAYYFRPIISLERVISHRLRLILKNIFFVLSLGLLVVSSGYFVPASSALTGLFFLSLFLFLVFVFLDAFYYSYVFEEYEESPFLYELATIFAITPDNDLTGGFIRSDVGRRILLRAGVSNEELKNFLVSRNTFVASKTIAFVADQDPVVSYVKTLFSADLPFQNLLVTHGLTLDTFVDCSLWVMRMEVLERAQKRWWSRDRLETVPSLARDWAYGKAYTLMKMSGPLRFSSYQHEELHDKELSRTEIALARSGSANVMIVGDEGVGKIEIVEGLARKIMRQLSLPPLRDKHFFVLDISRIRARATDARELEHVLLSLFSEAVVAGNTIIVIPDMADFMNLGHTLGINLSELMGRFFTSPAINIIGIVDTDAFHLTIESDRDLTRHFEVIMVEQESVRETLTLFLDTIYALEGREGVLFTFPALLEVVNSAEQYFPEVPLFDRADDLLRESSSYTRGQGGRMVTREDVKAVVQTKTGVHTEEISQSESQILSNLETLLHERVVGQDEAVQGVSDALRRARIGVNNPNRPVGSFLFLGPTGVGKTETAKALSEIFFGHTVEMLRLNMSEYNSPDSLNRLIGAYNSDTPGILSNMVREKGYGVLLLDEFEKTDAHVLDLFLQVLDEGMFQDALGRKINARNLIIIATSNAGSDYIFEAIIQGGNLAGKKDEIVSKIVHDGIFKPELLNRFDAVILFHPLEDAQVRAVAKTMVDRLAWRLKEKGLTLVVNDAILNFLASQGRDQKFGARALNRVIQDTIEKKIADRMIAGQYKAGSRIEFTASDFS